MANKDQELKPFQIAFTGKWKPALDGTQLGENDFQTLTNMRYIDAPGVKSIQGMTKINTTALTTYTKIKSGIHFRKENPSESHVLVQAFNSGETQAYVYDNTTAVPSAGSFSADTVFSDTASSDVGRWNEAPDGCVTYCNTKETAVWGGTDYRCAGFVVSDLGNSIQYNYTKLINNTLDDSSNVAVLNPQTSGGNDANSLLLLHLDNNLTDSSPTTPHTVTNFGWSNADITNEAFASLTGWTDGDGGTGASTQETFDSRSTFRFTNTDLGVANYALRTKDVGTIGTTFVVTIVTYFDLIGNRATDGDDFKLTVDNGEITLDVSFGADGLWVYDGAAYNEVGTNVVALDEWHEWTFVVNAVTAASATCSVYQDDVLLAAAVDCSNVTTVANGTVTLRQNGTTTGVQITYTDALKIGSAQEAVSFSTTSVFGSYSASFDPGVAGKRECLTIPDAVDFNLSAGTFTIDMRVNVESLATNRPIYYQSTDTSNYCLIYISTTGAVTLSVVAAASEVVAMATAASTIVVSTWYHIEVMESGDNWYIFVDGILKAAISDTSRCANYTGAVKIGGTNPVLAYQYSGLIDELRVSNSVRHTNNFTLPIAAYGANNQALVFIGATRPIKGVKFQIGTANTNAATATCYYWSSTGVWTAVSSGSDGTILVATKTLSGDGTYSFTSTLTTAKPRFINGIYLYWYLFVFDNISTTTSVHTVTIDSPMQSLVDLWDGVLRPIADAQTLVGTAYVNVTTNLLVEDYVSSTAASFLALNSFATTSTLLLGFTERMTALDFDFGGGIVNSTIAVPTIKYWTGAAWTSVGVIVDDTTLVGATFAQDGKLSWTAPASTAEFSTSINGGPSLYYYQLSFSATLDGAVSLDAVYGCPAQKVLIPYAHAVNWQNRLVLIGEVANKRNSLLIGAYGSVCVFNGDDTLEVNNIGDDSLPTAAGALFTRYTGDFYDTLIICKKKEVWVLDGSGPASYRLYRISDRYGCVAPETFKIMAMGQEVVPGIFQHVAVWQTATGLVMFDGNSIHPIDEDIRNYFDLTQSECINTTYIHKSTSFIDEYEREYHWQFVSGTATTINTELVYNFKRKAWFKIERTPVIYCGIPVRDSNGASYTYGGTATGFLERLEFGNTFDTTALTATLKTRDNTFAGWVYQTMVRYVKLIFQSKSSTAGRVTLSHFGDTKTTADSFTISCNPVSSTQRVATTAEGTQWGAYVFHSFNMTITSSDVSVPFEPVGLAGFWADVRKDT